MMDIIEIVGDNELEPRFKEFEKEIDSIIFRENHHTKFREDGWYRVAKILNWICRTHEIDIEFLAGDDKLVMDSPDFNVWVNYLPVLVRFFRAFWRHQRDYEHYWCVQR